MGVVVVGAALSGCYTSTEATPTPGSEATPSEDDSTPTLSPSGQLEQDIAEYEALTQTLEESRREVLGDFASEATAYENRLFWLEFPTFDPSLHSYDKRTGDVVDYDFYIGSDRYNYRATNNWVVTAVPDGDDVFYRVYDAAEANDLEAELTLDKPSGAAWWAYNVHGNTVYYIIDKDGAMVLWAWPVGGQPSPVISLDEAGLPGGEIWGFAVDTDRVIIIISGAVYTVDLGSSQVTSVGNQYQVSSFSYDEDGILYSSALGPYYYTYADALTVDIGQALLDNGYQLNDTYNTIHHYAGDTMVKYQKKAVYKANSGVFAYDLVTEEVTPILLDPRDIQLDYRYPTVLDDGTLYIQAILSVDGPIYEVAGWAD